MTLKKWFARAIMALGLGSVMLGGSSAQAGFTIQDLKDGTYTGSGSLGSGITYAPTANGHGILVGDKEFTRFDVVTVGDMPPSAAISVTGTVDGSGNLGILFTGFFTDLPGGGGSDDFITYHVHVTDPVYRIYDAHISGNPAVLGGTGAFHVVETFAGLPNVMSIFANSPGTSQLSDSTIFSQGYTDLDVQKDIGAFAGTGTPSMSFVSQTFSQRAVPEPGSFVLMGLGLVGAGIAARNRRKMVKSS